MKKAFGIIGILIAVLLLTLILLPFVFKGKILEIAKKEVNKTMNAEIDFGKLGLNFFQSFPHATVTLEDFYIAGVDEFAGDTLLYAQKLSATVNLKSLFGDSGYEITQVSIDGTRVTAIMLENEKANWEIVPSSDQETDTGSESSDFQLQLKKLTIKNSDIVFDDRSSGMGASLAGINLDLTGDMSAEQTNIRTGFSIDRLNFTMDKIPYLSKATAKGNLNIEANLKDMKFTLAENELQVNEIKASIDGWLAMLDDDRMEMDIRLNAPKTQFKDILSMIPAIYANDFKDLQTAGEVTLEASAKGLMQGDDLPAFDVQLAIGNAMFQYPDLPKAVTNINTQIHAYSPGGSADQTIVDIPRFHFEMADNPFDLSLHVSTPVSDPNLSLSASGKLNLDLVKEVYPLEDMELAGQLDADMKLATRLSYVEKEQFDKVEASGKLTVQNLLVKSETMDDVQVNNASLTFNPRHVDLNELSVVIGKNDVQAKGKLENFIPYFMADETLRGTLSVQSSYLNLNDFMSDEPTEENDSTAIGVIEIPQNLDFTLQADLKQVVFDNLEMKEVKGRIRIKDGKAEMTNLLVNALDGQLTVNGYYDSAINPKQPEVSLDLNIKEASFAQTFSTFVTIQKLAPIFENMNGSYSTSFKMTSSLEEDFMPVLTSLTASGLLASNNLEVKDVPALNALATTLQNESLKELQVKDLSLPFSINDGRIATKPFDVKFGGGVMNLSGSTGLDQSIDYVAKVNLSDKLANNYLKSVNVTIGGTFKSPKIGIDTKDAATQLIDNLGGKLLGGEDGQSLQESVTAKVDETKAKIDEEIEKQAEKLRQQAKESGQKLIDEAEKKGQQLIDKANETSNPIAKIAAVKGAEAGAQKLKEEAEKQAKKLEEEAEKAIGELKK